MKVTATAYVVDLAAATAPPIFVTDNWLCSLFRDREGVMDTVVISPGQQCFRWRNLHLIHPLTFWIPFFFFLCYSEHECNVLAYVCFLNPQRTSYEIGPHTSLSSSGIHHSIPRRPRRVGGGGSAKLFGDIFSSQTGERERESSLLEEKESRPRGASYVSGSLAAEINGGWRDGNRGSDGASKSE